MKNILIIILILAFSYFVLRFWSGYSLAKQVQVCATKLNTAQRYEKATKGERREIRSNLYDCVEKNLSFPGSLGYNSKKFRSDTD